MNNIKMAKGLEIRSNTERVAIENNIVSGSTEKCINLFNKDTATLGAALGQTGATYPSTNYFSSDFISVKSNNYYIYSGSGWANIYDKNKNLLRQQALKSFITPENATYIRFCDLLTNLNISMLVQDTILPTDYQPFFTGLRYGYYKGLQLDKFSYVDKTNKIKHKGGKSISLNGNENWVSQYDTFGRFMLNIPDIVSTSGRSIDKFIITEFTPNINAAVGSKNEIMQGSNNIYIYPPEEIKTLEEWKTYLKYNPAILNYELATPSESGIEEF